jgi:putative transposase
MKFTESEDIEAIHAPFQTLNANAVTERWVRTIREECLGKMIILNEQHLRQLLTEYLDYHNERRPHQGLEQDSPLVRVEPSIEEGSIRYHKVLGGIIRAYYREAA